MRHPIPTPSARLGAGLLTAAVLLTGCAGTAPQGVGEAASPSSSGSSAQEVLAAHGLEGRSAREVVDALDRMPVAQRPQDLMASVRSEQLQLTGAAGQGELPMPQDAFYLSAAPYVSQTHPCTYHSLTTCLGELGGQPVTVTVTDDDGAAVHQERTETFDNGFVGLWVPRGIEHGTLTIEHEQGTARTPISTDSANDPTCLTDLQLT